MSQITPPSPASGLSGPTPVSQAGFRKLVPGKGQQLTLLSIEIHADTRYVCTSRRLSRASHSPMPSGICFSFLFCVLPCCLLCASDGVRDNNDDADDELPYTRGGAADSCHPGLLSAPLVSGTQCSCQCVTHEAFVVRRPTPRTQSVSICTSLCAKQR